MADRFGSPPEPVSNLLALARLRARCRRLGIARLEVGPNAAAASFRGEPPAAAAPLERKGERILLARPDGKPGDPLAAAEALLTRLGRHRDAGRGEWGAGAQAAA